MTTRTRARTQRAPTPVASENPAADAAVAAATEQAPVPEQDTRQVAHQPSVENLTLAELIDTLEARSADVSAAIDHLYEGSNDPAPATTGGTETSSDPIRGRVAAVVSELHGILSRIEQFTERLGAPL